MEYAKGDAERAQLNDKKDDQSLEDTLIDLPQLFCLEHKRYKCPLVTVCLKRECPDFGKFSCAYCQQQHAQKKVHEFEDFIHLQELIQQVMQHSRKVPVNDLYEKQLKPLLERAEKVSNEMFALSEKLKSGAHSLMKRVREFSGVKNDYVAQQINEREKLVAEQGKIMNLNSQQEIDEYLKTILGLLSVVRNGDELEIKYASCDTENREKSALIDEKDKILSTSLTRIEKELADMIQSLNKIEKIDFKNGQKIENIDVAPKKTDLCFSDRLKSAGVTLQDYKLTARCNSSANAVALIDCQLNKKERETFWALKLIANKHDAAISAGVTYKNMIEGQGYFHNQCGEGFGMYELCTNGSVFYHDAEQNEANANIGTQMKYTVGDTLYFSYSPRDKILSVSKNKSKPYLKVQVKDVEGDDLYPMVWLFNESAFEIVQDDDFSFIE